MTKAKLLMIQGTSSGAGKSTLVTAFCRIFNDKGYRVVPFKAQNMSSNIYITNKAAGMISLAQAIQAIASRKNPDTRMNPILLKPLGDYRSRVILRGKYYSEMYAKEYYERFILQKGLSLILNALDSLRKENDIVVIEGAGSPAEINISKYDIANMLLADKVCAPVIITADIERGGCFANIVGTMRLLKRSYRKLVIGFLINKFLGEKSLLGAAISYTEKITQKEFFGIIPKIEFNLPNEDSLNDSKHPNDKLDLTKELWDEQIDIIANIVEENINMQKILMKIVR